MWFTFLVITTVLVAQAHVEAKILTCKGMTLKRLGCYKDNVKNRPLPELVLTYRDKGSKVYAGEKIDWKNWNGFMEKFICRCAERSANKGYSVIGLQKYGECWSGPDYVTTDYARQGPSPFCVTWSYGKCKDGYDCVGVDKCNFVYRVKRDFAAPTAKPTVKETTPTPSATPSPTPSPTPSQTPSPAPSPTPSSGITTPGVTSPKPSGSGTSTAKRPEKPTTSPSSCTGQSSTGCQQPTVPCVPPYQQLGLGNLCPQMPYPSIPQMPCGASCSAKCAPHCNQACCQSRPQFPISYPQFGFQSPRLSQCRNGCPSRCAPRCSIACCQSFAQNMMSSVPRPMSMVSGYNFQMSPIKGRCRNGCSNRCAPRCNIGCCLSVEPVQFQLPQSISSGANFRQSQFPLLGLQQRQGYPLLRSQGCSGSCPAKCAPRCALGCCRWFGGFYKKTNIMKHEVPSLDDD